MTICTMASTVQSPSQELACVLSYHLLVAEDAYKATFYLPPLNRPRFWPAKEHEIIGY